MSEIFFTRAGANGTQLSRTHTPGWAVEVWRDEEAHPIVLHRHSHDRSTHTSLYMTPAQARALAAELLHAADVAQPAAAQPKPKQQSVDSVTLGAAPKVTDQAPKVTDHFRDATKMMLPTAQVLEPVERRQLDIGKAIERACADLPEETEIIVSLEKDASTVTLIDRDGNEHENFSTDYGFADELNEAIDAAIAAQSKQGGATHD